MRLSMFVLVLLAACGTRSVDEADLSVSVDFGPDLALDETPPSGPYAGAVGVASSVTIEGSASLDGGMPLLTAAHVTDSVGTIDYQGSTYPAIAYQHIAFGMYDLAALVAATQAGFVVSYAYCEMGQLTYFYTESLDLPPTPDRARGTCTFTDGIFTVGAMFDQPQTLGYGPLDDRAEVDGSDLTIHDARGTVMLGGKPYDVDVFTTVDCSQCGGAGWHELHATIRDASTLAFGIFYLNATSTDHVLLAYGFRFDRPALWPPTTMLSAAWSLK